MDRMLAGLSSRRYPVGLEPVGARTEKAATATSKSAVSRRFVAQTETTLAELLAADLSRGDDGRGVPCEDAARSDIDRGPQLASKGLPATGEQRGDRPARASARCTLLTRIRWCRWLLPRR